MFIPRRLRQLKTEETFDKQHEQDIHASELRDIPAWVLLAEPGAGKSALFLHLKTQEDGHLMSVSDFLDDDIDPSWREKTLFLDGLDEAHTGVNSTTLRELRKKLNQLKGVHFRISCRSADWLSESGTSTLSGLSVDNKLPIFSLKPLNQSEMIEFLKEEFNHLPASNTDHSELTNPDEFIQQAEYKGVVYLLENPITLKLLVSTVIQKGQWPASRTELYKNACELMIKEHDQIRREQNRFNPTVIADSTPMLQATGQLFARLLLGNLQGVAIDPSAAESRYPDLDQFEIKESAALKETIRGKMFKLVRGDCFEPIHRSVAEYLAACWLAQQLDKLNYPLTRLLTHLTGFDGRCITALRGLFGWLATLSIKAKPRLMKMDPITVAQYGDIRWLDASTRKKLLSHLKHLFVEQEDPSYWKNIHDFIDSHDLSVWYDKSLNVEFQQALTVSRPSQAQQKWNRVVLKILLAEGPYHEFKSQALTICRNSHFDRVNRSYALRLWLKSAPPASQAEKLLDDLIDNDKTQSQFDLSSELLEFLYPKHLSALEALRYLKEFNLNYFGSYSYFWGSLFPDNTPVEQLPELLSALKNHPVIKNRDELDFDIQRMHSKVVLRTIEQHGKQANDSTLLDWLRAGVDQWGYSRLQGDIQSKIDQWLIKHTNRHEGLLGECSRRAEMTDNPVRTFRHLSTVLTSAIDLHNMPHWHLNQAATTQNRNVALYHLHMASLCFKNDQQDQTMTLDDFFNWAGKDTQRLDMLDKVLICPIDEGEQAIRQSQREYDKKQKETQQKHTQLFRENFASITSGEAPPSMMAFLADLWQKEHSGLSGNRNQRFAQMFENPDEVLEATEQGLHKIFERNDLPSSQEIIQLYEQSRRPFLATPCLVSAHLIWKKNPQNIDHLSDQHKRTLIAFKLTNRLMPKEQTQWFGQLLENQPELVAQVLLAFFKSRLKNKQDIFHNWVDLEKHPQSQAILKSIVIELLQSIPLTTPVSLQHGLNQVLQFAIKTQSEELTNLIRKKLKSKTLRNPQYVAQKSSWLMAGLLLNPNEYEDELLQFIDGQRNPLEHALDFCRGENGLDTFSEHLLAKFIEWLTPFSVIDRFVTENRGSYTVTTEMNHGDTVRALIHHLANKGTQLSIDCINNLLINPELVSIHLLLTYAKQDAIERVREAQFKFPNIDQLGQILNNGNPTSAADLQALLLEFLREIQIEIQTEPENKYALFWNPDEVKNDRVIKNHKTENECRDVLLGLLKAKVQSFGIELHPESSYVKNKRADIRASCGPNLSIPIELKGNWHPDLWHAMHHQADHYTKEERSEARLIYGVFWAGANHQTTNSADGGTRPQSPEELQQRLDQFLEDDLKPLRKIVVIDICKP